MTPFTLDETTSNGDGHTPRLLTGSVEPTEAGAAWWMYRRGEIRTARARDASTRPTPPLLADVGGRASSTPRLDID